MDIGNLTSAYSDIYASASNQSAAKLEGKLQSDYAKSTDKELMDACKQFEAYFVEQMYKEMMKTVPKNEEMAASTTNMMEFFEEQMVQKIASDSTEHQSLGLAQTLYDQMRRNYGISDQEVPE